MYVVVTGYYFANYKFNIAFVHIAKYIHSYT